MLLETRRYVTSDDVVELKGKVACEISSADELTLTELIFSGLIKDIQVEEMVSLLSCFVWQEKLKEAQKPRDSLELLFAQLQDTARKVAKVQLECKVPLFLLYGLIKTLPDSYFNNIVELLQRLFINQYKYLVGKNLRSEIVMS